MKCLFGNLHFVPTQLMLLKFVIYHTLLEHGDLDTKLSFPPPSPKSFELVS